MNGDSFGIECDEDGDNGDDIESEGIDIDADVDADTDADTAANVVIDPSLIFLPIA